MRGGQFYLLLVNKSCMAFYRSYYCCALHFASVSGFHVILLLMSDEDHQSKDKSKGG